MQTSTLEQLKRHLRPGRVYRRADLLPWSQSVDRHLKELTVDGTLQKLRTGLYYCPRKFEFGEAPADEHELVKAFLKTDRFVVTSPNAYNQLGLGTTQLYNKRVVYNQKRHGTFPLDRSARIRGNPAEHGRPGHQGAWVHGRIGCRRTQSRAIRHDVHDRGGQQSDFRRRRLSTRSLG